MISRMSTLPSESDDFNDLNGFNGFNAEKHKIIDVPPFLVGEKTFRSRNLLWS